MKTGSGSFFQSFEYNIQDFEDKSDFLYKSEIGLIAFMELKGMK